MKRILKNVFCIILSGMLLFGSACKQNEEGTKETGKNEKPAYTVVDGKEFINDGKTEYKVLLPENSSTIETYASGEFQTFFYEATGIAIDIVNEQAGEALTGKYVSIGNTTLYENAGIAFDDTDNLQAFKLRTVNDNYIIAGNGDYGTLWGVYEILTQLFDYEFFSADTYKINRAVEDLPLYNFDMDDQPDIEIRVGGNGQTYFNSTVGRRLRFVQGGKDVFIQSQWRHNSFGFFGGDADSIDPRFLGNTKKQLCYTAYGDSEAYQEMVEIATNKILEYMEKETNKAKTDIMIGVQDHPKTVCECSTCLDAKEKYGSNSGAVVVFINNVHRLLTKRLNDMGISEVPNISFFAYCDYELAPVKRDEAGNFVPTAPEVKCDPGVNVMIAPINANWQVPLDDPKNVATYENIQKWSAISDEILMWSYHNDYYHYFIPFDCFNNIKANYNIFKQFNVRFLFDQGKHDSLGSGFITFREYLESKIAWDTNADLNTLTNEFFAEYFGDASDVMLEFYNSLRMVMAYNSLTAGAGSYGVMALKNYWSESNIIKWLDYIDQAYKVIEPLKEKSYEKYDRLYRHILQESLAVRYLYIKFYVDSTSKSCKELQKEFILDCEKVGITMSTESMTVKDMFK